MHDPPGTIPPEAARVHPRRIPAHRSVSLRHSPPASRTGKKVVVERQATVLSSPNAASDKANPPSVSPQLQANKYSSGESSDAGRWFEITNNNAHQSGASAVDNDPPFFLRNSSSSETPPEGLSANSAHYPRIHSNMPYRPTGQLGNDGSSTEDFRSVIDDLTIANKRLKRKLKKYENSHDARLEEDKLFEVRFHGLPDHKKKELEETLRKFAAGLDEATADYPPITSYPPTYEQQKTQSSTSNFNESGYASMSASGQNSSSVSNQASNHANDSHKMSRSAYNQQQQSIQSYLHDVHGSLLPQNNVLMTDKSKKKMVVRRLEQIFAGKVSVPGSHPQPMQQEEVAQSAATADREEREATGRSFRPEGLRVARILSGGYDTATPDQTLERLQPHPNIGEQDGAGSGSPDQRPTRPLDLDLLRAQVPGENMEYIRHLGFTPPDMETGDQPEEGHGWLYLNLLINMAQLHTLNVTPEFVKDALNDYSGHLELSSDGRKIRWKGGLDMTKGISDSSSEHLSGDSPLEGGSPIKRQRTDDSKENEDAGSRARKIARATRERELEKFAYKPMFFKRVESEDDDDSYGYDIESSGASMPQPHQAGDSSGFGSSAMQSGSSTRKPREDGPLIFYTKAKFCTDLSGDRLGASLMPGSYQPVTSQPLGVTAPDVVGVQHRSGLTEPRGPMDVSPMELDSNVTVSSEEYFGFSPALLRNDTSGSGSPAELMDFEVSGLGGVRPEDNFAIRVRRSQTSTAPVALTGRRRSNVYSKRILRALGKESSPHASPTSPSSPQRFIKNDIISASRKTLPNSELPPASYLPFDSTSSGDVDSESDSGSDADESSEADSESGEGPATAMQMMNMSTSHQDSGDSGSEASQYSEDTDDDGSVDFLATARQIDPNTIRNQEREYDAAVADRLAEEIVAGSSAATAGGGSGFNTPAAGLHREDSARKQRASTTSGSLSSRSKLKRSRTNDGRAVKAKNQKTSD